MDTQRIVVKLGTSTLTDGTPHLNHQQMLMIVQQIARLHQAGHEVLVVSSGAMAAGRERLNFTALPGAVPAKQMLSAIGQPHLMRIYSDLFDIFKIVVAQVLLTRGDLSHRPRYLNARDTLTTLLEQRVVPIINENDTVATEEIRVGDNDNLSALVASAVEANLLIILTDQQGLFTADPRRDANAALIQQVVRVDNDTFAIAGGVGTAQGTGGMITKIQAAQTASRSGVITVIASGNTPDVLARIMAGEAAGTRFEAATTHLESRKRWMLTDKPHGKVYVDAGAARALLVSGASLLPVGMTAVDGVFERGATIAIFSPENVEIAHGLSNYSGDDLRKLYGVKSARIGEVLGYSYGDYVIHRNNMVMLT